MRDFHVFDTEYGVASLILKEVPYRREAYIIIQSTQQPEELLKECVSFCRAVGAERIYARGHAWVEQYPLHTIIYEMRGQARAEDSLVENLWPVTEETVGKWRAMMNERMTDIDNSGTLEKAGEQEILASGGAYFVHHNGELLGGFWLQDGEIKLIASVVPGGGRRVMHTLYSLVPEESLTLQVVSTNLRAIRFYEKLGFFKTRELRSWFLVN